MTTRDLSNPTPANPPSGARRHRRLLALGLLAGLGTAGTAGALAAHPAGGAVAADAPPGTSRGDVPTGARTVVESVAVSPAALPAVWQTGGTRRTTTVSLLL
ncbi:hypothetical protein [Kineococcus sp. NPDC059986]|uniref:hypothetical protein n=1 Tax=Kineococcus sp. NPDC059986 TaxID=3155538 RepID=UPI00344C98E0